MLISRLPFRFLGRSSIETGCLLLGNHNVSRQISTTHSFQSKMTNLQPVTHVIFDMDGLLLDTVPMYEKIRQQILSEFGCSYDVQANLRHQGLLGDEVALQIITENNLPITAEEFRERAFQLSLSLFANAQFLPDTECIYEKLISDIAAKYGKKYTSEVRLKVLGTNEQTTSERVVEGCGLPISKEEFLEEFRSKQVTVLGDAGFMEGAERLVRHLHEKKIPIAVATSSGSQSVKVKTAKHQELFSLFHHIVMGSSDPEVKNGKPHPDIFQICASRFDDKPACEKCLVFEDAPNGVTAGRAAGMQVVMVPDEHLPADRTTHATVVLKSLVDFKPEDFGLPAFK